MYVFVSELSEERKEIKGERKREWTMDWLNERTNERANERMNEWKNVLMAFKYIYPYSGLLLMRRCQKPESLNRSKF